MDYRNPFLNLADETSMVKVLSEEFQDFVEACHLENIGVLVDWVPGHFCVNDDCLAYYDGTPTFEYQDADRAKNVRWGAIQCPFLDRILSHRWDSRGCGFEHDLSRLRPGCLATKS